MKQHCMSAGCSFTKVQFLKSNVDAAAINARHQAEKRKLQVALAPDSIPPARTSTPGACMSTDMPLPVCTEACRACSAQLIFGTSVAPAPMSSQADNLCTLCVRMHSTAFCMVDSSFDLRLYFAKPSAEADWTFLAWHLQTQCRNRGPTVLVDYGEWSCLRMHIAQHCCMQPERRSLSPCMQYVQMSHLCVICQSKLQ